MPNTQKEDLVMQIEGIKRLSTVPVYQPTICTYLIVETCQIDDFLRRFYEGSSGNCLWDYLFGPEVDDEVKKSGPVLIELQSHEQDWTYAVKLLEQYPAGCLLTSTADFESVQKWGMARVQIYSPSNARSVCRFYDPRNLAYCLGAQEQIQRRHFWHQAEQLYWYDQQQWWTSELTASSEPLIKEYRLSQSELATITVYKEQQMANQLSDHYRNVIPKDNILISELVHSQLPIAKRYGASNMNEFDPWLRIAIVYGGDFYRERKLQPIFENSHYPIKKKLALSDEILAALEAGDHHGI
ncbi:DUF4123 domain-containing protein [Photobacterium lipolyticum]|uniref:DUF4123 domain-containing protein n=1 Tax=Photobacterium lipolyticum TaxID=266810 RepID=A0A2T3MYL4_9GAMM|nr:DUF4123 domain-containing protein [Photobacterium lipolyticum]PSW05086.1 hypothetical protein C9I89_09840 [Photobacterium lipolyticum]